MHSYTFNSERPLWAWLVMLAGVLLLLLATLWYYESYRKQQGHQPQIQDTRQNWALERLKLRLPGRQPLVFAGASRTLYGIDMATVRQTLPQYRPVMLAVNGHYSFALLEDLANDPLFDGMLLLDLDSRGLARANHGALQPYLDYFHREFSPSRAVHQAMLRQLQYRLLFIDKKFGWLEVAQRRLGGTPAPLPGNTWLEPDRNASLDLANADNAGLAAWFHDAVRDDLLANPPASPQTWLQDLARVPEWVAAIRERGGEVIFYVPPVAGRQASLAEEYYPRAEYWQAMIDGYGLKGLDAADIDGIQQFELPDESHLDYRDKPAYTRLLLQALQGRGLL